MSGLLGGIISIAGLGLEAFGLLKGGDEAEERGEFNAQLYEKEADYQLWKAGVDLERHYTDVRKLRGTQTAGFAHAGVTEAGTPTDVLADTAYQAAIDAALIRQEGERKAEIAKMGGSMAREEGKDISRASKYQAANTLLTGLSKFNWKNL